MSHSNLRILYVITDLKRGGVPLHLHRLARAMRDRGWSPTVVSLAPMAEVGDLLQADGFDVRCCGAKSVLSLGALSRLRQILDEVSPQIAHSFLFHANVALRWAAMRSGFPVDQVVCEIQTVEVERNWHLWVDRWMYRYCRTTIGNSPSVVDHLEQQARIPRKNLTLVRGGIDPAPFENAEPVSPSELGLPLDAKIALWAGRLDPVKGLDHLLAAWKQLHRKSCWRLLLVGEGPLRSSLEIKVNELSLEESVHFLGSRDDVERLLKSASLFVFPSRTEGLPNALLEAMAAELPIVTTDVPGCRDLIEHDHTGLLVSYGDTSALAEAVNSVLHDDVMAQRLGLAARQTLVDQWGFESSVDAYERLYQEVIGDQ